MVPLLASRARTLKWRLLTNAPKSRNPTNRIFSNCRTLLGYTINAVTTGTITAIVQRREPHAASLLTSSLLRFTEVYGGNYLAYWVLQNIPRSQTAALCSLGTRLVRAELRNWIDDGRGFPRGATAVLGAHAHGGVWGLHELCARGRRCERADGGADPG